MSSLISKNPGVFDPTAQFAFTNITEEDFDVVWDGRKILTLKPNQTIELPHHLANKCVDEMVDKIMMGIVKMDEVEMLKNNPMDKYPRSPKGPSLGVPEARKEWEDKIVKKIEVDPEDPKIQLMRAQVRDTLVSDMTRSAEPSKGIESVNMAPTEFAEIKQK